ncbi:HU family DNA-binding protein [Devosia aurantiaca]|uniref:Integration host factor subunit alpha n=1 Tax=Devosia aurantiaca TaxID=2714858 RepID=A0A6M1SNJ5_9HYPH|nr:HU family DNA-binding protein [Devosia aurantiaca]NGP17072.1 integration host factor subunit alpha [Devosia aurantiaca]
MDKTVTRAALGEQAAAKAGIPRADAAEICQRMFDLVGEALMEGESVKLTGFGSLQVRSRAERVGRNPRTGEEHRITPHRTVVLIPSAKLRKGLEALATPDKTQK